MYDFKYGYIYKITNLINDKIYIGQVYNKSIYDRFNRHCRENYSYLSRAIHKYGKNNFKIEIIEECYSIEELNEKEKYWISYYGSTDKTVGYNLTDGGDGGNTYAYKSKAELDKIKYKIAKANTGANNGQSKSFKIKSIKTNIEYKFDTLKELTDYFNIQNKDVFTSRAMNKNNILFRKEWLVAYEDDEYKNYNLPSEHTRGTKVKITNLNTNHTQIFGSRNELYKFFNISRYELKFENNLCYYQWYKIELLK